MISRRLTSMPNRMLSRAVRSAKTVSPLERGRMPASPSEGLARVVRERASRGPTPERSPRFKRSTGERGDLPQNQDFFASVNTLLSQRNDGGLQPLQRPARVPKAPSASAGGGGQYSGKGALTADQVADILWDVGFRDPKQIAMWTAIARRESGYNPGAHALDSDDDSYGLFQINVRPEANPKYKGYDLTDPYVNARVMYEMSQGGKVTSPWAIKPDGSAMYKGYEIDQWMPEALAAAQRVVSRRLGR